jgi:predicted permease
LLKDLRHAVRVLLQAKGWSAVVLLSLSLGIGANTAIFSALNGLLLKEIPVSDPQSLVRLRWSGRNDVVTESSDYGFSARAPNGQEMRTTFSYAVYRQFVADNRTMSDLLACAPYGPVNVVVDGQAEIASAFLSTGNYYRMLGVRARLGRTLSQEDDRPAAPPAAVISSEYWHTRFATDPGAVGRTIRVNNVIAPIVGVIAANFTGIQQPLAKPPDIGLPLSLEPQLNTLGASRLGQPTSWWLQVMGRLKAGATAAQVQGDLEGVFRHTARADLDSYLQSLSETQRATTANRGRSEIPRLLVDSGSRGIYDVDTNELRSATILSIVVGLVLLIVCVNVANLLLSRAGARRNELAVRLSLGATRSRLIRQLLTESLLLASLGGGLGVLVGYWGKLLLPGAAGQASLLDWHVLAFLLGITGLTGVAFGIAPALRATRADINSALQYTSRSVTGSRSLLGRSLLVLQVAISVVLLVGAGLFLSTLHNLRRVDVGFNPHNLLLFRVSPELSRYDDTRTVMLYRELLDRIGAVPGVRATALTNPPLLSGSVHATSIYIRGRQYANRRDSRDNINQLVVSPNFFEVLEIPLLRGRAFTERDNEEAPKVVVINEAAAKRYFTTEDPIGQRFGSSVERSGQLEIVGVVRDAKYDSVRDPAPPTMYLPFLQARGATAFVAVRTAGDPAAVISGVREGVRQIDPNLPMMDVSTQIENVEASLREERTFAHACTLFGGLALLLVAVGLFGLVSYGVARRTNEVGIRMALGARRQDVLWLVMRESMVLVVLGVGVGVAVALAASRFVATLLFGVAATDPVTIAASIAVMVLVSALAVLLPARRASRVDPMTALRYE